jgi:hypothetical protein
MAQINLLDLLADLAVGAVTSQHRIKMKPLQRRKTNFIDFDRQ